jgi:hypothetical protein
MRVLMITIPMFLLGACASRSEREDSVTRDYGRSQERVAALFSEAKFTARCFSVIEPEPNQFIQVDLASIQSAEVIQNLDDCAHASERSRAALGTYVSDLTRVASSGMAAVDRFEFNPSHWPVEFHFNNKIYHIYQGKLIGVEGDR